MFSNNKSLSSRIRTDLLEARRARDQLTTTTLQAVVSAIDNAGAVPASENTASIGVGSTEAPRRELSEQDLHDIVKGEIVELKQAIKKLGDAKSPYANELNDKIIILEKYL